MREFTLRRARTQSGPRPYRHRLRGRANTYFYTMPSRTVINEILACYLFNQNEASQLTTREVLESGEGG